MLIFVKTSPASCLLSIFQSYTNADDKNQYQTFLISHVKKIRAEVYSTLIDIVYGILIQLLDTGVKNWLHQILSIVQCRLERPIIHE